MRQRKIKSKMTSLALDFVTVKGFKSIASIEKLELGPINVLIGANGSGKSNFIRDLCEVPHIASAAPAPILVLREG